MAKNTGENTGEQVAAVIGLVTGFTVLTALILIVSYLPAAWLADYLYSNTFEAQGIGPVISYWQFVGGVVLLRLFKGVNFSGTTKD